MGPTLFPQDLTTHFLLLSFLIGIGGASSTRLPSQTNVFVQYYADWFIQCNASLGYFIMSSMPALFFVGVCLYITEIVSDIQRAFEASAGDSDEKRIIDEVALHKEVLGLVDSDSFGCFDDALHQNQGEYYFHRIVIPSAQ